MKKLNSVKIKLNKKQQSKKQGFVVKTVIKSGFSINCGEDSFPVIDKKGHYTCH